MAATMTAHCGGGREEEFSITKSIQTTTIVTTATLMLHNMDGQYQQENTVWGGVHQASLLFVVVVVVSVSQSFSPFPPQSCPCHAAMFRLSHPMPRQSVVCVGSDVPTLVVHRTLAIGKHNTLETDSWW